MTACAGGATAPGVAVLTEERAVEFPAVVQSAAWDGGEMAGYHLVVWRGGGSADAALFRAEVSDVEVLDALESLGAAPGDALDVATWDERRDPTSWKPDRVIEGPPVEVLVRATPDGGWLRLDQIVDDPMGVGFEMRFGGHRANIPAWRSGCVVCLYSCPGGKIGNARYTVRDFARGTTRFAVRDGVLPRDGERVTVRIRLTGAT
ncbi:MAG TPA: YdjY domain-containing protein [Thermoanaerobaculia bacterium]|nr:YdjY domain-containing protein [Thermoanaerobaculia bacterium]